jgi:hypothetical protein
MKLRRVFASAVLAVTSVCAQDAAQPAATEKAPASDAPDSYLGQSVRAVGDRIATIIRLDRKPLVVAVRADEAVRNAEAETSAQLLLPSVRAAARGRAWSDLGLGLGTEPQALVVALVRDLPGMILDASRERLLVDPQRLLPDAGRGDPDADPDAAILLATGVAPDEPLAGHYLAHAFLDGPPVAAPATTDALLAWRALAEGSANLAALVLLFEGVGLESEVVSGALRPEEVLGGNLVPETMRAAEPVVSHLLEFVYLDGFAQAAIVARKGGFGRLTQERRSRRTTRDVLHLDRPPAPPVELPRPVLPAALGLSPVDEDSLGEQGVITLVSLLTGKDNLGLIAGDGWMADALWRFEPGPGSTTKVGEGATIWETRWKSDEDAADFAYGLERCLQSRFGGEKVAEDPDRGGQVLRRTDRVYRIDRTGLGVVFQVLTPAIDSIIGPPAKKKGPSPRQVPAKKKK